MKAIRLVDGCLMCLSEDAIYFTDKHYLPVVGQPEKELTVKPKASISEITNPFWRHLYPTVEATNDGLTAFAGESSWGGAGFIALKRDSEVLPLWVIHLSTMNNPTHIKLKEGMVRVITDLNYPNGIEFLIPVDKPENFKTEIPGLQKDA